MAVKAMEIMAVMVVLPVAFHLRRMRGGSGPLLLLLHPWTSPQQGDGFHLSALVIMVVEDESFPRDWIDQCLPRNGMMTRYLFLLSIKIYGHSSSSNSPYYGPKRDT